MQKSNSIKVGSRKRIISILAVSLVALFLLAGIFYLYNQNQQNAIYSEREANLKDRSEKVTTIIDTTEEAVWPIVELEAKLVESGASLTKEALIVNLNAMALASHYEGAYAIVIDENGRYLSSDGGSALLEDTDVLIEALDNGYATDIIILPHIGNQKDFMIFILPTEGKMPGENTDILFTAFCIDAAELGKKLNIIGNESGSETIIVRNDGRRIFTSDVNSDVLNGFNLFTELGQYSFTHSSAEELIASAQSGNVDVAEFIVNETRYLISCNKGGKNWIILNVVKTEYLSTGIADYMKALTIYLAAVFGVIVLLLVAVGIMVYHNSVERAKREKEEIEKESLRKIAEREKAASAAKTEFLSNMSHDIRTPINGIMGMTTIAKRHLGDSNPNVRECLNKIDGASNHLLSLINDVLDMSRIERGKTQIAHDPMDIGLLTENCGSIIHGQMQGRDLNLLVDTSGIEHRFVIGDELHTRQILINILGNAVKFTPDGGTIRFSVSEKAGHEHEGNLYTFTIEDTGIGMKPEFLEKIFEPFSQEEGGARTKYKGTGLGMAITKQFVDLMGGTIEVESEYNRGSKFTVVLPLLTDESHKIEAEHVEVTTDLNGLHILLVEDNELNQEIAQDILEEAGAKVELADNGQIALEMFSDNAAGMFDLILMDVMMPVMDGLEATRRIRALDREDAKTIPILAMTANAFEEDRRKVLEAGMNAHLSKPIQLDQLFKEISNHVRRRGA